MLIKILNPVKHGGAFWKSTQLTIFASSILDVWWGFEFAIVFNDFH